MIESAKAPIAKLDANQVRLLIARSPFALALNIIAREEEGDCGNLRFRMPCGGITQRLQGSDQVHGGAIAALMDITADYVLAARHGAEVPTVDLLVDFLRPAASAWLEAVGYIRKMGRALAFVDIEVRDADSKLVALGRGTYWMS